MLQHTLSVRDVAGRNVGGVAEIGEGERSWRFTPDVPWEAGEHQLVVEPRLEDVAGNSPARVFDRDVTKAEDAPGERAAVVISFSCVPVRVP